MTDAAATSSGLLHEVFERSARLWPERVAVDVPPGPARPRRAVTTYAELNRRSDALARRLRTYVNGECVAGILLPRSSADLYAAQLAVLKAGAAYTCVDPAFPDQRVREILEDSAPVALLTDAAGVARCKGAGLDAAPLIDVGEVRREDRPTDARARAPWLSPESLAYVTYTSGTTGRPKGVMIEHRGVVNLVASDEQDLGLSPDDRVSQNSSAAYDSSVEETWLAFAAGATLVVMDDDAARLGPDLVPWLRRERISVFCPPPTLLRAMGCEDPGTELPELRLVYVGGEALPSDVADRWAGGGRLVNGYGPTECSVTCARGPVEAGQPVTIGRPIPGVSAFVLDESLGEVAEGRQGELCIGGVALARGYWRRPDLTAEKFVAHPRLGRIYRTGDLAHRDPHGRLHLHGRIDSQVKLRGYRIELGEVEARLARCPGVRSAACQVRQDTTLVALVVPVDPARPPAPRDLHSALGAQLPGYMVPAHFGILDALPTTVGGKLDRSALPRLDEAAWARPGETVLPRGPLEARIAGAFAEALGIRPPISIHDDFFVDLGGDSLTAAQLVTLLRRQQATAWVAVRDVYESRTVAELAARAPASAPIPAASAAEAAVLRLPTLAAFLVQSAWLLGSLWIGATAAYAGAFHVLPALAGALSLIPFLLLSPALAFTAVALYAVLALAFAVLVKRSLIGRYRPTREPVWSEYFVRHWLVQQAVKLVPWRLLEGTELLNAALRALGARIGERVHVHRGVDLLRGGFDLLEIGDDVTLCRDVALGLVALENGHVAVRRVTLGAGSTLDIHSHVGGDAIVDAGGFLTARSSLPPGWRIPPGERWDGIPARPAGRSPEAPALPPDAQVLSPWRTGILVVVSRLALLSLLAVPAQLCAIALAVGSGLDEAALIRWLSRPTLDAGVLLGCVAGFTLPVPLTLALEALACRLMGRVEAGVISRWSPAYVRLSLKAWLLDLGSHWLYGTLFWPAWLRLAGMKIGKGCEISSLYDSVPEQVEIGEKTFCADGIYLGGPALHRGTVSVAPLRLGRNNFVGNGAVLAGGLRLPDDVLLGVCTVAEGAAIRPGTSWFGHPPLEVPRRHVVQLDPRLTHSPSSLRYAIRVFWEVLRFALPSVLAVILPAWYLLLAGARTAFSPPAFFLVAVPASTLGGVILTAAAIVLLKWAFVGRVRPSMHPLWSSWASRWDFVCLAWSLYMEKLVSALDGTPYLHWLLRAVGVRIGRGVVIGAGFAGDLPDPDMLTFEDGATVDCMFQAHTFEDRVLKMDCVTIRQGATLGRNALLLYGAEAGAGACVAPNSVVMKHEHLLPGLRYEGFPTQATGSA